MLIIVVSLSSTAYLREAFIVLCKKSKRNCILNFHIVTLSNLFCGG